MIFYETAHQGRLFLLLLYAGVLSGVLYDLASLFRRSLPGILRFLPDLIWCLLTAALCFFSLLLGQESQVRLFAPLGLMAGGALYGLGIRRIGKAFLFFLLGRKKRRDGEFSSRKDKEG